MLVIHTFPNLRLPSVTNTVFLKFYGKWMTLVAIFKLKQCFLKKFGNCVPPNFFKCFVGLELKKVENHWTNKTNPALTLPGLGLSYPRPVRYHLTTGLDSILNSTILNSYSCQVNWFEWCGNVLDGLTHFQIPLNGGHHCTVRYKVGIHKKLFLGFFGGPSS